MSDAFPWIVDRPAAFVLEKDSFERSCASFGVNPRSVLALMQVETAGYGFYSDKRMRMLFERHVFSQLTNGRWDKSDPGISNPSPGGYAGSQPGEYVRLRRAFMYDQIAALQSASWGLGQIMGYNLALAGSNFFHVLNSMAENEAAHLSAMMTFIQRQNLVTPLNVGNWDQVAFIYNGPNYTRNHYSERLQTAYANAIYFDWRVRKLQIALYERGCNLVIDGIMGPRTRQLAASQNLHIDGVA